MRPDLTLQGVDSTCVALFGSMSKTLSPALSLGWDGVVSRVMV